MPKTTRRIGFLIVWAVLLLIVASLQLGHQMQFNKRAIWMDSVDEKLASHERKLDILSETMIALPETMLQRFKEVYKK